MVGIKGYIVRVNAPQYLSGRSSLLTHAHGITDTKVDFGLDRLNIVTAEEDAEVNES